MYEKLSKKIGLPVEMVRRAMWNLEHKARGLLRPNGLYLHRMETRMEAQIQELLDKQLEYVVRHAAELSFFKQKGIRRVDTKALDTELRDLTYNLPHKKEIADTMKRYSALVMLKGAQSRINKLRLGQFGINFNLTNTRAVQFLNGLTNLHLSDKQGSITRTTKNGIIKVISEGAQEGLSYGEMAKRIRDLGEAGIFSPARSQLIATRTIAEGYEFGNREPMKEAQDKGLRVQKSWVTVGDDKVTPECAANEDEEWLEMDEAHSSGDQNPPRLENPRCRCSEAYRVID